jgi:aspartate racemase
LESVLTIPFIHIADALGKKLSESGITKIGLLGTDSTMQSEFYKKRLSEKYQIDVITPDSKQCRWLDNIIFSELCFGVVNKKTQQGSLGLIEELTRKGAQAIALACTELPLLLRQTTYKNIPLFDTSLLHCQYAVNWSLNIKESKHEQ